MRMPKVYIEKMQAVPVMTMQAFKDTFPTPALNTYTNFEQVITKIRDYAATIRLPMQVAMTMNADDFRGIYDSVSVDPGNPASGGDIFGGIDGAASLQLFIDKNTPMNRWMCRGWLFTDASEYSTTPTIYAVGSPYGNEDKIYFAALPAITWKH